MALDWLNVAAAVDLYSRRVVGWSMGLSLAEELGTDALIIAVWHCGKPGRLLQRADQGSQNTSEQFPRRALPRSEN